MFDPTVNVDVGRLGFIGAGNMAMAIMRGAIRAKVVQREGIAVYDVNSQILHRLEGGMGIIGIQDSNIDVARTVDTLILAVKPQILPEILKEIAPVVKPDQTIISIAAGVTLKTLQEALGDRIPIVRVMPNTPVTVGEGFAGMVANRACGMLDKGRAARIFGAVGKMALFSDEAIMDAVTAVSGSGPAYFFLLMEALVEAAVKQGIDEETAREQVIQTAKGAACLAEDARESIEDLRRMVTSPGGTTEAALKVFESEGFKEMVEKAVAAAAKRSKEMAKGA